MDIKAIKEKYDNNVLLKDIAKKHHITLKKLNSIIKTQDWHRKRRGGTKGNKGGRGVKGNKGNKNAHPPEENKNAVVTGEYENIYKDVLEDDELELYENYEINDAEQLLIEEYKILTIREKRMLQRIKDIKSRGKDMTINYIRNEKGKSTKTITDAEPTINLIQRLEDALTRVQEAKRRCVDSLHKIEMDEKLNPSNGGGESLADTIQKAYEQRINAEREDEDVK